MNIQKLEAVFHEMESARFESAEQAGDCVRAWAERIHAAITEHLLETLQVPVAAPSGLSGTPGGHDWE